MDARALAEDLYDLYSIEVGLCWKVIDPGSLIHHLNDTPKTLINDDSQDSNEEEEGLWSPLAEKDICSFFTQEAIERTEDMYYNNNKHCIIDPLIDNNLELVI